MDAWAVGEEDLARRKGGRPIKLPEERRSDATRARLTLSEKQELVLEARLQGISEGEYIRRRLGFGAAAKGISSTQTIITELESRGVDVAKLLAGDPIKEMAKEAGISEPALLRRLLEFSAANPQKRERAAIVSELNAIGHNVNQLARATHRGADFVRYWQAIGAKLETILERLLDHD